MIQKNIHNTWLRTLSQAMVLVLLFLYFLGSLQIESFHKLLHAHDEAALHSPEQEENDCHRLIYHNQTKGDCKHKSHITELKKCPLCQIVPQQVHVAENQWGEEFFYSTVSQLLFKNREAVSVFTASLPGRSPPGSALA